MRTNRVRTALQTLGGTGTTQDITRVTGARPECISSQLSGMEKRDQVRRAGQRLVPIHRWDGGQQLVPAIVWELTC